MSSRQGPAQPGPLEKDLPGLSIKDRINHPYILARAILTIIETSPNPLAREPEIRDAVMMLYNLIPDEWHDENFNLEIDRARTKRVIDVRPSFCGKTASLQWCISHGVPANRTTVVYNHHLLVKACINLLQRRALLSRKALTEIMTGGRFEDLQHMNPDELMNLIQGYGKPKK